MTNATKKLTAKNRRTTQSARKLSGQVSAGKAVAAAARKTASHAFATIAVVADEWSNLPLGALPTAKEAAALALTGVVARTPMTALPSEKTVSVGAVGLEIANAACAKVGRVDRIEQAEMAAENLVVICDSVATVDTVVVVMERGAALAQVSPHARPLPMKAATDRATIISDEVTPNGIPENDDGTHADDVVAVRLNCRIYATTLDANGHYAVTISAADILQEGTYAPVLISTNAAGHSTVLKGTQFTVNTGAAPKSNGLGMEGRTDAKDLLTVKRDAVALDIKTLAATINSATSAQTPDAFMHAPDLVASVPPERRADDEAPLLMSSAISRTVPVSLREDWSLLIAPGDGAGNSTRSVVSPAMRPDDRVSSVAAIRGDRLVACTYWARWNVSVTLGAMNWLQTTVAVTSQSSPTLGSPRTQQQPAVSGSGSFTGRRHTAKLQREAVASSGLHPQIMTLADRKPTLSGKPSLTVANDQTPSRRSGPYFPRQRRRQGQQLDLRRFIAGPLSSPASGPVAGSPKRRHLGTARQAECWRNDHPARARLLRPVRESKPVYPSMHPVWWRNPPASPM